MAWCAPNQVSPPRPGRPRILEAPRSTRARQNHTEARHTCAGHAYLLPRGKKDCGNAEPQPPTVFGRSNQNRTSTCQFDQAQFIASAGGICQTRLARATRPQRGRGVSPRATRRTRSIGRLPTRKGSGGTGRQRDGPARGARRARHAEQKLFARDLPSPLTAESRSIDPGSTSCAAARRCGGCRRTQGYYPAPPRGSEARST